MRSLILLLSLAATTGCRPAITPDEAVSPAPAEARSSVTPAAPIAAETPAFAGKVWRVQSSSAGEPGSTYAFAADGALVIDSPNGTPMHGQWRYDTGKLMLIEEGIAYPTDIVRLDATTFQIRSHNPGGAVDIVLVHAPDVPMPASGKPDAVPMPGSDLDRHGCKPSAGYSWCARTNKCERPWELAKTKSFENTREAYEQFCGAERK